MKPTFVLTLGAIALVALTFAAAFLEGASAVEKQERQAAIAELAAS